MDIQPDDSMTAAHADYALPIAYFGIAESEAPSPTLSTPSPAGHAAELALRRSQDRLDALVRAVGQIIWTTNVVGLVVEDLPTWRAYTGQSAQEIKGWGWMSAVHPADRARVARTWSKAVVTRSPYEVEYRLRSADGVYRTFLVRGVPVFEADGEVREWVGCHTDITERQQLAQQQAHLLQREQEMHRELEAALVLDREHLAAQSGQRGAELATASLAMRAIAQQWDIDQVLDSVLEQAKGVLGTTMAALLVIDPAHLEFKLLSASGVPAEIRAQIANLKMGMDTSLGRATLSGTVQVVEDAQMSKARGTPLASLLAARGVGSFVAVPLHAQYHPVGVLVFAAPLPRSYDAESRHFLRLLGDIFAVAINAASLQERLRASNAQLVTASLQAQRRALTLEEEKEGRETFISLVAHELRSPLTTLSGYIQLLGHASMQEPERREGTLRTMREQANRLKRLIDDLLDVSRIASGHFALQPEVTDLAALARKVVEEAQATTNKHTIRLDLDSESIIGVWDRQRLAQVLSNLLSNALKYSPQGGEIQVVMELEPESLQVTIQDPGVGLQPEEIALLFQPYARLGRTRKTSGSGLGLYITKGIIEAHGGHIEATSVGPDCGSAFRFTLPYQAPSPERQ